MLNLCNYYLGNEIKPACTLETTMLLLHMHHLGRCGKPLWVRQLYNSPLILRH